MCGLKYRRFLFGFCLLFLLCSFLLGFPSGLFKLWVLSFVDCTWCHKKYYLQWKILRKKLFKACFIAFKWFCLICFGLIYFQTRILHCRFIFQNEINQWSEHDLRLLILFRWWSLLTVWNCVQYINPNYILFLFLDFNL